MAAAKPIIQDMPPKGGYQKICYRRIPAKTYFSGYQLIGGYIGITVAGLYVYYLTYKQIKQEKIEMRSAQNVIIPLLIAERDREYLKQLGRNRAEEESLMSKVKGWEVGTWYGEPVYHTLPADQLVAPIFKEFYAHASYDSMALRAHTKLWSR